jgi:Tol biopolymer transport system component
VELEGGGSITPMTTASQAAFDRRQSKGSNMTRQLKHVFDGGTAALLAVVVISLTAGCSWQYHGVLGVTTPATMDEPAGASGLEAKGRAKSSTKAAARPAAGDSVKSADVSSPKLNGLGPVDSAVPAEGNPAASFETPADGHAGEHPVAARPGTLNVFGELPQRQPGPGSPLDSDNVAQVTFTSEGGDFDPEIDPTGKWIIFASTRHREAPDIYLQKIGGTTATQLTNDPARDIMPVFSPDGSKIAFASDRAGNWDLYLMDVNGGQAQQVTNNPTHDLHPSFSPDGRKLVYCSYGDKSGQWEIVIADLINPSNRQILCSGLFPKWSPKGDRIVFQRARERGTRWFSVWTIDLVDGEARRATEIVAANNAAAITPSWSPDGQQIVFATVLNPANTKDKPAQADVWVVNLDGTGRSNLTNSRFANLQPRWGGNGMIYFVSNRGKEGAENIWSLRPDAALNNLAGNKASDKTVDADGPGKAVP